MLLPRMRAAAVVALFLHLCATVVADQGTRPSLQQAAEALWNPTVSLAMPASASYEDDGDALQKDTLCLRAVNQCGTPFSFRTDVTCCGQHGQHKTVRDGLAATSAGYCQIAAFGSGFKLPPTGGTVSNVVIDSVGILCRLTQDAARCGLDDCGDVVLWGQGEATEFFEVVIEGPLPEFTDGCPRFAGGIPRATLAPPLAVDNTTQQLLDAAKQAGREAEARGEPAVNIGRFALFYSGPITVQSRTRPSTWQHGWFTYSAIQSSYEATEEILAAIEADSGPLPRVTAQDFNTYRFELYRDLERS